MSSTLNGSSVIQLLEDSNAIEIYDRITFDFYTGLPQIRTDSRLENVEHCGGEPEQADTGIQLYAVPRAWQAKLHVAKQYSFHEI